MKRNITLIYITVALFAVLSVLSVHDVHAQGFGWSRPFQVSDSHQTPSSWFPDITVDLSGTVHVLWSSGKQGKTVEDMLDLLMYRRMSNGRWLPANDIIAAGEGGYTVRNSIVAGRDGHVHVIVRRGTQQYYTGAPANDAWSAQAWSTPRLISNSAYYNAIAVDSKGRIHALYNEQAPADPNRKDALCSNCADLYYRASDDEGRSWTPPVNLSNSPDVGSTKPQIKIGSDDSIHVVWEEGFDWYANKGVPTSGAYRRSIDGGKTWDPAVTFTLPDSILPVPSPEPGASPQPPPQPVKDAPKQMTIGLSKGTRPIVVYRGTATNKIYYQYQLEGSQQWSGITLLPGVDARDMRDTHHDAFSMPTDSNGNVHLVFTGVLPGNKPEQVEIYHMVWNGITWSPPELVAGNSSYSDWSAALIRQCARLGTLPSADRDQVAECNKRIRYPEWVHAVVSAGNRLHVTWFTRSEDDRYALETQAYQVWYSFRQINAPAIAMPQMFTPVSTATPMPATPTPAPTLAPTLVPAVLNAPQITGPVKWEASGLSVLAAAILPVLLLIVLLVGARALALRRRKQ